MLVRISHRETVRPGAPKTLAIPDAGHAGANLFQAYALKLQILLPEGLNLGFFIAFSLIAWLISIQIIISSFYRRIESLGIVVFPISGLASLLAGLGLSSQLISTTGNAIQGHIMISVVAYSLITLGAFHAGLLAYQDRAIREHHPGGFIRFLPPLHDMETLLFQFLAFGFICLSISLVTGFFLPGGHLCPASGS